MIGRQPREQGTIFVMGSLGDLVPEDHILKRVDRVLDLGWLRDEVRDSYCEANGRPSVDPEAAVRLMLAGFFQGVVKDRKLMREAQVNVAIRWFAGYAHSENYRRLEERGTEAVIPPQPEQRVKCIPLRRFKYDGRNKVLKCPRGRRLKRTRHDGGGWLYRTRMKDCRCCPLRRRCHGASRKGRTLKILDGYEALLRARRKRRRWGDAERSAYGRHRWKVEGVHGEEKEQHGLRRAVRRRLWNVAIQAYLAAAVVNLKRLAALLGPLYGRSEALERVISALEEFLAAVGRPTRISDFTESAAA